MTEKSNGSGTKQLSFGGFDARVVTIAVGGLLLAFILYAFNAPQRADDKSLARHDAQELDNAELRAEVREIRGIVGRLQLEVRELGVQIKTGVGDRFTGAEAAALRTLLDEREQRVRTDVTGLKDEDKLLWQYSLEERRLMNER